jgi:pimeloyl-ACP methyl ester carboxylesterase
LERFGLPPEIGILSGSSGFKPDSPTLILIHGAGASSQSFLPQLRQLDRFINILALDLPGHGQTPGPGMNSIFSYADWVYQVLNDSGFKTFFLGGHSMGGAIGLEVALRFPDRIIGLILMATAAYFDLSPDFFAGLAKDPSRTLTRINRQAYMGETSPFVIAQSLALLEQTPLSVIQGDFQACRHFDCREAITRLNCPVLIVAGDQDITIPLGSSEALEARIPDSRLLSLPGAAHMVMLEKPKEVNQAVCDFIAKLRPHI